MLKVDNFFEISNISFTPRDFELINYILLYFKDK
jgi:hypothetical protein